MSLHKIDFYVNLYYNIIGGFLYKKCNYSICTTTLKLISSSEVKKMKRSKHLIGIFLMALCLFTFSTVIVAAASHVYSYTYYDSVANKTFYKIYKLNSSAGMYVETRRMYSKGNGLYTPDDIRLTDSLKGSEALYNVFDSSANFFYILSNGDVYKYPTSGSPVLVKNGGKYFECDDNDIGITLVTTSGTYKLSSLSTPIKSKDRVEQYESNGEMVFKAYKSNRLMLTLIVSKDEKKVLNYTNHVVLTECLTGTKFAGIDKNLNVYLYEGSDLYKFKYGSWYSASKATIHGTFCGYNKDQNGFTVSFKTSSGYEDIRVFTDNKWTARKTYAVNKGNKYALLYVKGTTTSTCLKLKGSVLYLGKKKVATGVSKFGFISSKKFVYIKSKKAYICRISSPKTVIKTLKATTLKKSNSNGLVIKVGKTAVK